MIRYQFLRFPQGKLKAVTFSYDDGAPQDVRFAQTLTRHGLKGTFNFNSDEMRKGKTISKEDAQTLILDQGHEIAVHGYNHRALGLQRPLEGIRDVLDCRLELESKFGRIIRGMAYPDSGITRFANGADYPSIQRYLSDLGIAYSRSLGGDNNRFLLPTDWYNWIPTAHHNHPHVLEWIEAFNALKEEEIYPTNRYPRLFYVWGHSYEFDNDENWDHLETICENLGGKSDVWYATNIQICDYVKAYESLIYSADGKLVYNPTNLTVWTAVDKKTYSIAPSQTLDLRADH